MSFFDSKEEVLNIELTTYGKKKLLEGTFKPAYYSFHDDGVIYDLNNASIEELQISSSIRILEQSLYTKPQIKYDLKNTVLNNNNSLQNLIGNSSINSDNPPAWSINLLKGEINTFQEKYKESTDQSPIFYNIDIPQINLKDIKYDLEYVSSLQEKEEDDIVFVDKTAIRIKKNYALLDIQEFNIDSDGDNFEIEIFEIATDSNNLEYLLPLYFKKGINYVVNDILLDDQEISEPIINENLEYADNYFNLLVDEEIDLETISNEIGRNLITKVIKPPFGENC